MSGRRVLALYGALLLGFAAVVCRLYWLCSNTEYAVRAAAQSEAVLRLPAARGNFYDCGGLPLTGISQRWLALCFPGEGSYARLYPYADADGQARLYRERNTSRPFLLDVVQDVSGLGVRCYAVPRRYAAAPLAEQLIGYLDSEGHGVAGLEAALDDLLYTGERDTLHCAVTAQGRLQRGSEPILEKADSAPQGVRLTLSRSIQRAAEGVAAESMATGCILIIDVSSGKVRACVSLPGFDAANVGESLTAPDSPLLNRAFSAYAVGSVFKPVLAAAALEAGEGDFIRECPGYDALNGQVYRCAGSVPHGLVGLDGALEKSCNGYFIELGRELGPERVRKMAAALGFGKGQDIADGLRSASGVLPEAETLENEGQFANFCFGQGKLLATPLQVAGMMNTIAAGGVYHTPLFVECTVDETTGEELTPLAHSSSRRVFSVQTAEKLQELLAGVVAEGTGRQAAPSEGTAAGKTGTAQTGQFRDGEELKNYWFAGFYPAEKPRWTIVVMQDAQTEPEVSSAAIFARLCDALSAGAGMVLLFCLLFRLRYVTIYLYLYVCYPNLTIKGAFSSMAVIEIVGGVILLVVSVVIFALTLMQHTHGQGLAGVINGSAYGANNARLTPADQMLAKVTRIAGIIFFVVAILACVFASRLA